MGQVNAIKASLLALGRVPLTTERRIHSSGKFRDRESKAIAAILDTVDARPALFSVLAPQDHGTDDTALETGPSRVSLARRDLLAPLLAALEPLTELVSDDVIRSGEQVKDVSVPAYALIKANATVDKTVAGAASAALDFYGAPARARKANKARAAKQK